MNSLIRKSCGTRLKAPQADAQRYFLYLHSGHIKPNCSRGICFAPQIGGGDSEKSLHSVNATGCKPLISRHSSHKRSNCASYEKRHQRSIKNSFEVRFAPLLIVWSGIWKKILNEHAIHETNITKSDHWGLRGVKSGP